MKIFEKYSSSRDFLYSLIFVLILFAISFFIDFNFLNFDTQRISISLLQFFSVFFVFILTIITIMFMFDYKKSPILKKLDDDNLFNQIFKRFFDSLIVIAISVIYFLILSIYFSPENNLIFITILNFIILTLIILTFIRIYRCLKLLSLIYKSVIYNERD